MGHLSEIGRVYRPGNSHVVLFNHFCDSKIEMALRTGGCGISCILPSMPWIDGAFRTCSAAIHHRARDIGMAFREMAAVSQGIPGTIRVRFEHRDPGVGHGVGRFGNFGGARNDESPQIENGNCSPNVRPGKSNFAMAAPDEVRRN